MTTFRPTVASPGRLVRLGIVLDTGNRPDRLREIARMCDGAGIESLWVSDRSDGSAGGPWLEAWTALTLAAIDARHAAVGAVLRVELRQPEIFAAMAATLHGATGGRLELSFTASDARRLETYVTEVRERLARRTMSVPTTDDATDDAARISSGTCRISVGAGDADRMDVAARVADDALIPARAARDVADVVRQVHRSCEAAGRDPTTMGIAMEVPVSIGRTTAEARARATAEPMFRSLGAPSEVGVFGTLEQCQERVIELAHEGITDLRCVVPNSADVHDVIAQLTATVVGSVDVLMPNSPRSKAPDPPVAWGGRRIGPGLRIVEAREGGNHLE